MSRPEPTPLRPDSPERERERERFDLALRTARMGMFDHDLVTGEYNFTLKWSEVYGYAPEEVPHTLDAWKALVHPDDLPQVLHAAEDHFAGKTPDYRVRYRLRTRKGGWRTVDAVGQVVEHTPDGRPKRFIGVFRDAEAEARAERQARDDRARLELALEASNTGLFQWSVATDEILVSRGGWRLLGYPPHPEPWSASTWHRIVHPDDVERVTQWARQQFRDDSDMHDVRMRVIDGRGEWRAVHLYGRVIERDPDHEPVMLVGVFHDVQVQERAAEERRRLEERIQQAQKLESLGVLAGGIAHDFNNLLVGILGNVGLARLDLPEGAPAHRALQQIELAAQRAADLTRQLLAYSGRGRFIIQPANLSELVREMAGLLRTALHPNATLRLDLADELPAVEADVTQLRQVIMNLITNASDALGAREGVIVVRTSAFQPTREQLRRTWLPSDDLPLGTYVKLEVTDTGVGMDADTITRIFDPFYTTKFTGRGLGLAAVLGIVRGHRGAIEIDSEPGHGSTFTVLLPSVGMLAALGSVPSERDATWRGSGVVLLAEDDDMVRSVTAAGLRHLGFIVMEAADGLEAVERLRKDPALPVAALVDLTMPHLDGRATLHEIRRLAPELPVVMMSGYTEHEIESRLRDEPLAGFLQKPFQLQDLSRVLRDALARGPLGRPAA